MSYDDCEFYNFIKRHLIDLTDEALLLSKNAAADFPTNHCTNQTYPESCTTAMEG